MFVGEVCWKKSKQVRVPGYFSEQFLDTLLTLLVVVRCIVRAFNANVLMYHIRDYF